MIITLYTSELVDRIRRISHREASAISDIEERYRVEAGTEKLEDIHKCIGDAANRLRGHIARWLRYSREAEADNIFIVPEGYRYDLALTERRVINKAEALTTALNTFVVEHSLMSYYAQVCQFELSDRHKATTAEVASDISALLYDKGRPVL